jgi:C4-dicarboxylate transporter DctM subunit
MIVVSLIFLLVLLGLSMLPPLAIFIVVIGSIYAGWATPTESAALGVGCALLLAIKRGRLTLPMLHDALEGTMRTTAMITLSLCGAWFLNFVLTTLGVMDAINQFMTTSAVTPFGTLMTIVGLYLILGCFMESMVLMVVTVPVVTPVVVAAGYDPVWFGILVVLLMETAMITPPVGINLFIVQGIRRRGGINDIVIGVVPFVFSLLA